MAAKKFKYSAINQRRARIQGYVSAPDHKSALACVIQMGYQPIKMTVVKSLGGDEDAGYEDITPILGNFIYKDGSGAVQISLGNSGPSYKELIRFTNQLSTLLKAGVPLIEGLSILIDQTKQQFQLELKRIRRSVEKGASLNEAMASIHNRFDTLYLSVVRSGEATGNLDESLDYISRYMERNQKLLDQLKSALTYPSIVAVVAIGIIWAMLTFVIPSLAKNLSEDQELPKITQIVMAFSDFCSAYWLESIFAAILSGAIFYVWKNSAAGRLIYDRLITRIPLIGTVVHKIIVSRFCNVMSSMLGSGVPLIDVLETSIQCCNNTYMASKLKNVKQQVESGDSLSLSLEKTQIMPKMVVSMINIGEKSGKIDNMLAKVSEYFDEEVQLATSRVLSLIEPFLIVVVGGFIAIMLVAIYLPIFSAAG